MHIRDAYTEFILAQQADGRSRKTVQWYKDMLANGPYSPLEWLSVHSSGELETISTSVLRQYIAWVREQPNAKTGKPRSVYTVNAVLRCLHKFFSWCALEYDIKDPIKGRIRYPKNPQPTPHAMRLETAIELIRACGNDAYGIRNRAMLMFMLSSGARRGEVAGLTLERLDLRNRRAVVIGKGNKQRVVAFDDMTALAISEWLKIHEPIPPLFYNIRKRTALGGDGVRNIIRGIAIKAGVSERYNPHAWRHLFAQMYHASGGTIAGLSKLLGHASTRITSEIYLEIESDPILKDYDQRNPMRAAHELLSKKQEPPQK